MQRAYFTIEAGYVPSQPVTGENNGSLFRGTNMIVRGVGGALFAQNWRGVSDIGETVTSTTLTGTVSVTSGSSTLTGSGTKFRSELIVSQWIIVDRQLYNVRRIDSDTSVAISPAAGSTGSGLTAKVPHTIEDADLFRATMARGNVLRAANGNLLAAGQGEVRLNGSTLTSSLAATPQLKLAAYDSSTGNYSVYKLGMKTPVLTTVAAVAGGTKNMQAGAYSVRIVPARIATGGYNNPSEAVQVTLATGDKIRITFPAMDTAAGQDAWRVYGTLFQTDSSLTALGITGPWYYVDTITTSHVSSAGGTYDFEWRNAEIEVNELCEFDNDPPPPAAFIGAIGTYPVLISTNGAGRILTGTVATTSGSDTITGTGTALDVDLTVGSSIWIGSKYYAVTEVTSATGAKISPNADATASGLTIRLADNAPGPVIRPCKPAINGVNIEAFPSRLGVAVSPPETIIGWISGTERIYLMTENRLHIAELVGNTVVTRPFWRSGFRNAQAAVFVNGYIYGFTSNGATRSINLGDEGSEEHSFAAPVRENMQYWVPERVRVGYDPLNQAVCFFHSQDNQNSSGKYYTTCLMYMLATGLWSTLLVIESAAADMIVSGVGTISNALYLVANEKTYGWDNGSGAITWSLIWPFYDAGDPSLDKTVTGAALTCLVTNGNFTIKGAHAAEDLPVDGGGTTTTGAISLPSTTQIQNTKWHKLNLKEIRSIRVEVGGLWAGSGSLNRVDEAVVEYKTHQIRH